NHAPNLDSDPAAQRPQGEAHLTVPQPQAYSASNGKSACSFTSVSSSSAAGSDPATTPTPAKRRASRSRSRALRRATQNSPSSVASIQPTGPAYQPRSMPSSSAIVAATAGQGSPPTAGGGGSRPAISIPERGSGAWASPG